MTIRYLLFRLCILISVPVSGMAVNSAPEIIREFGLNYELRVASSQFGIEEKFLRSACMVESSMRHNDPETGRITTSVSGAKGICQIKPNTAKEIGCGDINRQDDNIACSARYFAMIRQKHCRGKKGYANIACMAEYYYDGYYRVGPPSRKARNHGRKVVKVYKLI